MQNGTEFLFFLDIHCSLLTCPVASTREEDKAESQAFVRSLFPCRHSLDNWHSRGLQQSFVVFKLLSDVKGGAGLSAPQKATDYRSETGTCAICLHQKIFTYKFLFWTELQKYSIRLQRAHEQQLFIRKDFRSPGLSISSRIVLTIISYNNLHGLSRRITDLFMILEEK